jgi:hypothetical protein
MRRMRGARSSVAWLVVMLLGACQDGRKSIETGTPEQSVAAREATDTTRGRLPELTQSFESLRSAFNAGKGEFRFVALLSPT